MSGSPVERRADVDHNPPGEMSILRQVHCFPLFARDNVRTSIGSFTSGCWRELGGRVKSQTEVQTERQRLARVKFKGLFGAGLLPVNTLHWIRIRST